MKNIRICTVVTGKTIDEFLKNLEKTQAIADFVELRVDYISNFSIADIDTLKRKTQKQAIFTCRRRDEGGFFAGAEKDRINILEQACQAGFDYVDVELSAAEQFDFSKAGNTQIIISFHDFKKTPSFEELNVLKGQMKQYPASIMKFSTNVNENKDITNLFRLLQHRRPKEKMIVIGMGEKGKVTRLLGPMMGSYFTYASTHDSKSAPGQIEVGELKKLYNEFERL